MRRGKNHATIRKQLIYMFESKLEEGQVYEMSSFSIFSPKRFLSTLHPYKFVFQIKTKLKLSESYDISQLGLTFTNLAEITAHTRD
ncbi:replication factor A protein [Trifolium repens]|nr:replication factor A protein [Trifolium repens]